MGLLDGLKVDPRYVGLEALLVPMLANISSQRLAMFSGHSPQSLVLQHCEPPQLMTGFETRIGEYEFSKTEREEDIMILGIVPKFKPNFRGQQLSACPKLTVVYKNLDSNSIGYMDVDDYTYLTDGFGYQNKKLAGYDILRGGAGSFLPKETKILTSPNHDGEFWSQGVNLNVCYMGDFNTPSDAFVISKSAQEKLVYPEIKTITIVLEKTSVPLNLYGNGDEIKAFPDIGEEVRSDGVLMAVRQYDPFTHVSDMTNEALQQLNIHDQTYKAPPGAQIIDVDVFVNKHEMSTIANDRGVFSQIHRYLQQHIEYYRDILKIYHKIKADMPSEGLVLTDAFNNFITGVMALHKTYTERKSGMSLYHGKNAVEFVTLKVTYMQMVKAEVGNKITGRDGGKGTISETRPDEEMPVDEYGVRADLIMSPPGMFNRMNTGQSNESFINRCAWQVRENLLKMPYPQSWDYLMGYFEDLFPNYAELIRKNMVTEKDKLSLLEDIRRTKIYNLHPPFADTLTVDRILYLAEKYKIEPSYVTYIVRTKVGKKKVVTRKKMLIGAKYVMMLCKLPKDSLNAVEFAHINQFGIPIKRGGKGRAVVRETPIRVGADEVDILSMSAGSDTTARILSLYGASTKAAETMQQELLTHPTPSNIPYMPISTEEAQKTNLSIALYHHYMGLIGYDTLHGVRGGAQ